MKQRAEFFRDSEFENPDFVEAVKHHQRCTDQQWHNALLNNQDIFRTNTQTRKLKGVSLGWGVVEVTLMECDALSD
jgi:hypothetical protein